jgi:hypothetical protein
MIYLLGYTNKFQTNFWPWASIRDVFKELDWETSHRQLHELKPEKGDIVICWNEPNAEELIERFPDMAKEIVIIQKLTSMDNSCEGVSWGSTPFEFYKNWHWPQHQRFARLVEAGYRCYAFGAKTVFDAFPKKYEIMTKYSDRIFEIPWGSFLLSSREIERALPVVGGFKYDVGYVGSRWGKRGRGNLEQWDSFLKPIIESTESRFIGGNGTEQGIVENDKHKEVLQHSKLCPIIHCGSWKAEQGVMDRFWTVFGAGRFGVCDNEGIYQFFDKDEVVVETDPEEYIGKSLWFMRNTNDQIPYIISALKRIKKQYNMKKVWKSIIETIRRGENLDG